MNWENFLKEVQNFFSTLGRNLFLLIIIFIAGYVIIKILNKLLRSFLNRTKLDTAPKKFLQSTVKIALYILLFYLIAGSIGIPTTGFLAVISAGGLAISLALQGSLSNLANGLVIISTKPFAEGDYVELNGIEGTVTEIKMMSTILNTIDNKVISIPNKIIVDTILINSTKNRTRNIFLNFNLSKDADIKLSKSLILNCVKTSGFIEKTPQPIIKITDFEDGGYNLELKCSCQTKNYLKCKTFLIENIYQKLIEQNISLSQKTINIKTIN